MVSPDPTSDDQFPSEPVRRRRVPAGKAIVVMFATLLLTLFLDGCGRTRTAERQHLCGQRTVPLGVRHPTHDNSQPLLLNRPRPRPAAATGPADNTPPTPIFDAHQKAA